MQLSHYDLLLQQLAFVFFFFLINKGYHLVFGQI